MSVAQNAVFDSEIYVPWGHNFTLYGGVDALTGRIKDSAVEYIAIKSSDVGREETSGKDTFRAMHHKRSSSRVAAHATINLGFPVAPGAKYWVDGHYGDERVLPTDPRLKLRPQAKQVVGDPIKFRRLYGDYFVCGFRRHYSFRAITTELNKDTVQTRGVGAGANVSVGNIGGVGVDADRRRSSEGATDAEYVSIHCYGCFPKSMPGNTTHFKAGSIEHAMQYVQEMERPGVYHTAILQHYSGLEPLIPNTVPANNVVFSELHRMDILYLNLELALSHPKIDKHDIPHASRAISLFERGRATFVDEPRDCQDALQALESATAEINDFFGLLDHRFRIERILLRRSPPKLHEEFKTGGERQEYGYRLAAGETTISDRKLREVDFEHGLRGWECLLKANEEKQSFRPLAGRRYTADLLFRARDTRKQQAEPNTYAPEFLATIVGFSLSCNDRSAKFTITTGGILTATLSVRVSAPYGAEWHCRIFFVEDKYYCLGSHTD